MRLYSAKNLINPEENIALTKNVHVEMEPLHYHDFIEIAYIFSGEGYQQINNLSREVKRGDILFLSMSDHHMFYPKNRLGVINCLIKPEFISDKLINYENATDILTLTNFECFSGCKNHFSPLFSFLGSELVEIENIYEKMLNEYENKKTGYKLVMHSYFNILLTCIFRHIKESTYDTKLHEEFMKITPKVLEYIEKNYKKKLTLDELARQGFYNPTYFSTVFKNCFNMTLTDYISQKRLMTAMEYLEETSLPVSKICNLVGFGNKGQFYKKFSDFTGITPRQYREEKRGIFTDKDNK